MKMKLLLTTACLILTHPVLAMETTESGEGRRRQSLMELQELQLCQTNATPSLLSKREKQDLKATMQKYKSIEEFSRWQLSELNEKGITEGEEIIRQQRSIEIAQRESAKAERKLRENKTLKNELNPINREQEKALRRNQEPLRRAQERANWTVNTQEDGTKIISFTRKGNV